MASPRELFDTALQHHEAGRLDAAVALYRDALALASDDLPARANLAIALALLGRHADASVAFEQALALRPDDPALRQNLIATALNAGALFLEAGQPAAAVAAFRRAVAAAPDHAAAQGSLGSALAQLGALDEADAALRTAIALAPADARLHYNRAKVLDAQNRLDDATAACRAALVAQPSLVDASCLLGSLLRLRGEPHAALAVFEAASATTLDHPTVQLGLGGALHDLGRLRDAVAAFRRAQALDPDNGEAHRSEALSLLLDGDFAAGWAKWEWRWRTPDMELRRRDEAPWQGDDLGGRTILLYAEQGLGDTIQFARYAPLVAARGGRVILQAQRPLLDLLRSLGGVGELVAARQTAPRFDVQAPLLSLPGILGTRLETIPAIVPYLTAEPTRVARWAERIDATAGRRVGLVWAGNPRHWRDRMRSLPTRQLLKLLTHGSTPDDTRWFSLQVGAAAADLATLAPARVIDLAPLLTDFAETAAAIMTLDLVISVDTSVAHLAGALGKPVWLLLPFSPDYRWLLGRADSPWYPTMRLFRQPSPGAWEPVIADVAAALRC
jgi:Flp pilus assembly protein TadD